MTYDQISKEIRSIDRSFSYYCSRLNMGRISKEEFIEKLSPKAYRWKLLHQLQEFMFIIDQAKEGTRNILQQLRNKPSSQDLIDHLNTMPRNFKIGKNINLIGNELYVEMVKTNVECILEVVDNFTYEDFLDDFIANEDDPAQSH